MIKTPLLDDRQELTETYLEPSRTSAMKFFRENSQRLLAVNQFHIKNSIRYFRLGSKYTFGLSYVQMICISEFAKFHLSAP